MFCLASYEAIALFFASIVLVKAEAQHDEAVGFTAWTESIQTYSYPHVIRFAGVGVNEGSYFNSTTHKFTCPYDGVYYVAHSSKRYEGEYTDIEIVKNNNINFMNVIDVYGNINNTVSNSVLIQCAKGEQLYVIGRLGGTIYGEPGVADSTFTVLMMTKETTGDILSSRHDSVVGFSAYADPIWDDMSYNAGEIIWFPNSIHYSPHYVNGVFTCPVTGVYYANMHVQKYSDEYVHMGISKDDITQLHVEETSGYGNQKATAVDFYSVGGGTAGCVLANRLSEDQDKSVLLLEAGGEATDPFIRIPRTWLSVRKNPDLQWGYVTEPQKTAWATAKVLGGSGSHNIMMFVRGVAHDFDQWAEMGNYNWSYEAVLPYFKKSEQMLDPVLGKNGYHGVDGLLETRVVDNVPIVDAFINAGVEMGFEHIEDYNGPNNEGISRLQINVNSLGERESTYEAFLKPVRARWNLDVITSAHVTKIAISDPASGSLPRAEGVYFMHNQQTHYVSARREVIVSAGPVGSPALLLHSGIGPSEHLQSLGIAVVKDLPVGKQVETHPAVSLPFTLNLSTPVEVKKSFTFESLFKQLFTGRGPWSGERMAIAFYKSMTQPSTDPFPYLEQYFYPSFLNLPGEIEEKVRNRGDITPEMFNSLMQLESGPVQIWVDTVHLHPRTRGTITLRSTDPLDKPVIRYDHLSHPDDVNDLIQGIRNIQKLINTSSMQYAQAQPITQPDPNCDGHKFDSDAYWECYIKYYVFSMSHFTSSCKMDPGDSGVVDDRLRVYGVSGLRVADSSVMPHVTSGHTAAPTIMIAEKAADMIKMDSHKATPNSSQMSQATSMLFVSICLLAQFILKL